MCINPQRWLRVQTLHVFLLSLQKLWTPRRSRSKMGESAGNTGLSLTLPINYIYTRKKGYLGPPAGYCILKQPFTPVSSDRYLLKWDGISQLWSNSSGWEFKAWEKYQARVGVKVEWCTRWANKPTTMKMWAFSVNAIWRKWAWNKFWNTCKRYRRGALPAELISQLGPGQYVVINSWMMDESPRWIIFGRHPPLPSYLLQSRFALFICGKRQFGATFLVRGNSTNKSNLVWVLSCIFLKATSISLQTSVNTPLALQQGFFACKILFKDVKIEL